jgi:hypothetical protein
MRRWVVLLALVFVVLFGAFHAGAAIRDLKANVVISVTGGQYELDVQNTGDVAITSFTFLPPSSLHVAGIVGSTLGSCTTSGSGFICDVVLGPAPCDCMPGAACR